jgi:hypothetical protein
MTTFINISKFLSNESISINDSRVDSFGIIMSHRKMLNLNTRTLDEMNILSTAYENRCIDIIKNDNRMTLILMPIAFKYFIVICLEHKLFSKLMITILNDSNISYNSWIPFITYCDIINDFIACGKQSIEFDKIKFFIDAFPIFLNDIEKFSLIMQCLPNMTDLAKYKCIKSNVLLTDFTNRIIYNNIQTNYGYKQLIIKLRSIEKEQKNRIRDYEIDKVWAYNKIASLRKEIDFNQSADYKRMKNICEVLVIMIGCVILYTILPIDFRSTMWLESCLITFGTFYSLNAIATMF